MVSNCQKGSYSFYVCMTFYFSREICNFVFTENFVQSVSITQCGNYEILLSRFFDKNFVKVTFLLKKVLNSWFDEIFYEWQ